MRARRGEWKIDVQGACSGIPVHHVGVGGVVHVGGSENIEIAIPDKGKMLVVTIHVHVWGVVGGGAIVCVEQ